jgi:hypothetical protein
VRVIAPHLPALHALRSLDLHVVASWRPRTAQQAMSADSGVHIARLTQLTGLVIGWLLTSESSPAQRCAAFGVAVGGLRHLQSLHFREKCLQLMRSHLRRRCSASRA